MSNNYVLKYVQLSIILGLILGFGLILNDINQTDIKGLKDKKQLIVKHNREIGNKKNYKVQVLNCEEVKVNESVKTNRGEERWKRFTVSFYDLSVKSCGKKRSHPAYGITRTGMNIKGKDWESARMISVDESVIPLGSKVKIKFADSSFSFLDGFYTSGDTGKGVKGQHIDLYYGENKYSECMDLGVTEAFVQVVK